MDLRIKYLLSWRNVFNNIPIAADMEEKLANQQEIFGGRISRIYLLYHLNGNHATKS